jgi:hypothetical protein
VDPGAEVVSAEVIPTVTTTAALVERGMAKGAAERVRGMPGSGSTAEASAARRASALRSPLAADAPPEGEVFAREVSSATAYAERVRTETPGRFTRTVTG